MVVSNKKIFLIAVVICAFAAPFIAVKPLLAQSSAAASEIRFQQLEKEIRRLTGIVEGQSYEIRRLRGEILKSTGDLEMRVIDLEGNLNISTDAGTGTRAVSPAPYKDGAAEIIVPSQNGVQTLGTINKSQDTGVVSSSDNASKAYDYAYSFIKKRDFARAETEFAKFIKDYPDSPLVANAKYWYGETFYVRGGYEESARIFAEGYKQFPKGSKAASNLLKLGMALTGMGKKDDACVAYKQLKKDYAKSSVPVLKRADTEMARIGCK